jgi:ferric-dicitrate binding protein FerR (iron transport regulator)
MIKSYQEYNLEDFIMDEDFQGWIQHPTAQKSNFWEQVAQNFPEKKDLMEEAKQIILTFRFQETPPEPSDFQEVWANILKNQPIVTKNRFPNWRPILQWAAIFILLVVSVSAYFYLSQKSDNQVITKTRFGETRKIELSDGTIVYLNANTSLTYSNQFNEKKAREVWLSGEAYFEVKKSPKKNGDFKKFIVHTKDLDVVVLGTKFNVNERRPKTQVVLNSGKVKLLYNKAGQAKQIEMQPGELVEFSKKDKNYSQKLIQKDNYSQWKSHRLIFEESPLAEVALSIEELYGYKIIFAQADLANRLYTGTLPTQNLDFLLQILASSFDVSIDKQENQIIIKNN